MPATVGHSFCSRSSGVILECVAQLPATRRDILRLLKRKGPTTTAEIARVFHLTHEGARKHVLDLSREGWIASDCEPSDADERGTGRPAIRYCLTAAGDHFFTKAYDDLLLTMLRIAAEDPERLVELLTQITDERVEALAPAIARKSLPARVNALRSIYLEDDRFIEVARDGKDYLLVERNCPYLNVALAEPAVCSTTVSTLRRLTEREVVRDERFQDGDGQCVFRIQTQKKASRRRFEFEPRPRISN